MKAIAADPSGSGYFSVFDADFFQYFRRFLADPEISRLICTCKRMLFLMPDFYKTRLIERFRIDYEFQERLLTLDPHLGYWKQLYTRLDRGLCGWKGVCLDMVTNDSKIYSMELVVKKLKPQKRIQGLLSRAVSFEASTINEINHIFTFDFEAICRWMHEETDAVTFVMASMVDLTDRTRFLRDGVLLNRNIVRHVIFEETEVIRGPEGLIALPNRYWGFQDGAVMMGCFDSGFELPEMHGMFFLMMEESIIIPPRPLSLTPGSIFTGLISCTLNRVVHYCRMTITSSEQGNLEACFSIDRNPGISSCRPQKLNSQDPNWTFYAFEAKVVTSDSAGIRGPLTLSQIVISRKQQDIECELPFFICTSCFELVQYGQNLVALFFSETIPHCIYLIPF